MIACFLSNISAKYYKNSSMLSRVIAKNVGDVFFETQCTTQYNTIQPQFTVIYGSRVLCIHVQGSKSEYLMYDGQSHT